MIPECEGIRFGEFAAGIGCRIQSGGTERVLWIHGYTLDSTLWDEIWSLLPNWTHYGIDLPGHGISPALSPGERLRDLGERLSAAACAQDIRHVVGLSFGSLFAIEATLRRPASFASLTVAAPAIGGGPTDRAISLRYQMLAQLFQQRGPGPWMTELWMSDPPTTFAHAAPSLRGRLASTIDRHSWSELGEPDFGIAALARESQAVAELAASPTHLLVMVGEHELPAFRAAATLLRTIRPDASYVELAGTGHLGLLGAPRQSADFLARHWDLATMAFKRKY